MCVCILVCEQKYIIIMVSDDTQMLVAYIFYNVCAYYIVLFSWERKLVRTSKHNKCSQITSLYTDERLKYISKFLIGNWSHVVLRIFRPTVLFKYILFGVFYLALKSMSKEWREKQHGSMQFYNDKTFTSLWWTIKCNIIIGLAHWACRLSRKTLHS